MGTMAMSWAIITPTVMRPTSLRSSRISSRIFRVTAVDETAMMKPSSTLCSNVQPARAPNPQVMRSAVTICPAAMTLAGFSTMTKARMEISMPMRNRSSSTPSSARTSMACDCCTSPKPVGPSTTPAMI